MFSINSSQFLVILNHLHHHELIKFKESFMLCGHVFKWLYKSCTRLIGVGLVKALRGSIKKRPPPKKNDHFWHFSVLPRFFKWPYLSHFLKNLDWNFFGSLLRWCIFKIEKVIGVPWLFNIVFRSKNSKTWFFLSNFWHLRLEFPKELFREGNKIYMKALIRNFHFKFESNPIIFVATLKKKY